MLGLRVILTALLFLVACQPYEENEIAGLPEKVDFNYHIRPILSDRCFNCHGPDAQQRKGELRLDTEDAAREVIRARSARRSDLYKRIVSSDPEEVMPPPDSKLSLNAYEVALIKQWIDEGAEWKDHWSFASLITSKDEEDGDGSSIDDFVSRKLETKGFEIQDRADPATLLRRVHLDLTGLPPSVSEVDQFLLDPSENSFEKIVDGLLNRPSFGERFAADWMDVARYADTHGFLDDTHREVWHWRNWVIKAFNENLAYSDFIRWQVAGDLFPKATKEQQLATTFNRLHRQNQEGGVLPEEYRVEAVADRVHTTATAFLGLTMECARCHDHKYDPISQKQFYEMAGFFNSTFETGRAPIGYESGPTILLSDEVTDQEITRLRQIIGDLEEDIETKESDQSAKSKYWWEDERRESIGDLSKKGLVGDFDFDEHFSQGFKNKQKPKSFARTKDWAPDNSVEGVLGKGIQFNEENGVFMAGLGAFERNDAFSFSLWVELPDTLADASIFDNADHKWHAYRGYELRIKDGRLLFRISHNYPQNSLQVESAELIPQNDWVHLAVSYNGSSDADGMRLFIGGKAVEKKIVHDRLFKSIKHDAENEMVVMPYMGLKLGWRMNDPTLLGGKLDEFKIYERELAAIEIMHLAGNSATTDIHESLRDELYAIHHPLMTEEKILNEERNRLNDLLTPIAETMVMGDEPKIRPTYILNRGQYDQPLEEVFPGMPDFLLPFGEKFSRDRMGLADWIVDPENPLTARVAVNRFWQLIFGRGLVNTPEDFGYQGEIPSHPELLDWLASDFKAKNWDVKRLIKNMVMSKTYQQSSKSNKELELVDPENRLLSRSRSARLPAEMIRDQALAASGLLHGQIGGESIKPYQPEGLWSELAFQQWAHYETDQDENLYRRTMYIYWKQNTPHPYMTTFDVGDRGACAVERTNTSSPTQALMLLNYPQFVEAARALSDKVMSRVDSVDEQVGYIYKALLSKTPKQENIELMKSLYEEELARYSKDRVAMEEYLRVGMYKPQNGFSPQLAALSVVSHSLMNSVDFYMES